MLPYAARGAWRCNVSNKWKGLLAAAGVMAVLALLLVAGLYLKPEEPAFSVAGVSNFDSVTLSQNLVVAGTADVAGAASFAGAVTMDGAQSVGTQLTVGNGITVGGSITVGNSLMTVDTSGNVLIDGTLDQRGNVSDGAGAFTIADNVMVDGATDVIQLTVQGHSTQSSADNVFVVEQSDGTDKFTISTDGNMVVEGTSNLKGALSDSGGALTVADNLIIDGAADAEQLVVQGHSTQTNSAFVVETSAGADVLTVSNAGNVDAEGTLNMLGVATLQSSASVGTELTVSNGITVGGAITVGNSLLTVDTSGNLGVAGASTLSGNVQLGDAIGDNINVYGQMRSYDGSDNWADIADVSALDRGNGWHASYNVTGWGGATDFQALFANTQVTDTSANVTFYGIEGKATLKAVAGTGTTTGIGVMGKVIAKTSSVIPEGYGVYSRLETEADDGITSGANFMADLGNSGTITTSRVIYTEADTWDNGVDLSAGSFTSDHVLQNGEIIENATDTVVSISAFTAFVEATPVAVTSGGTITATATYQPITSSGAVTTSTSTAIADGVKIGQILILVNENGSDVITIDDGGNTKLSGDAVLGAKDTLMLIWDGTDWVELAQANNT